MKKTLLIITLLLVLTGVNAQENSVAGSWILTKIETQKGTQDVFAPVEFQPEGNFLAMDIKMGTWKYLKKAGKVHITSEQFRVANGDNKIVKLDNEELVLENPDAKMFFLRINKKKMAAENNASGLIGTWKLDSDDNQLLKLLIFKAPDSLIYVEKEPGSTSRAVGSWIYNKKDNSLIITLFGQNTGFRGKNKITIGKDSFTLENNGVIAKAVREKTSSKTEHLNFTEDDFFDSDGNFKYENDAQKLPWNDKQAMMDYLATIHRLIYKYSVLIPDAGTFRSKILKADVAVENGGDKACIDYIFNGYDKEHLPEDTQLPPNCYDDLTYNNLFPLKSASFRVAGKEKITTPAGTFQCTVLEAVGSFDRLLKMWMIDDKPGVYAKIIMENKDPRFGFYNVYELQEIK